MPSKPTQSSIASVSITCLVFGVCGCLGPQDPIELSGHTQGTTYSIRTFCAASPRELQTSVERLLDDIGAEMSTYDPNSTLSRFNASTTDEWQSVPPALAQVVAAAQQLAQMSDGAFDVTVGTLVNVWGFGPGGQRGAIPSPAALAEARAKIGYRYLQVRLTPPALRKTHGVYVDLSAIAQGYTVDALAGLLDRRACPSYMIEVGGEVRVGRRKPDGRRWRIAVEAPDGDSRVQTALSLENAGVSTSGDYHDYFEADGRRYSHTMDPRVGEPIAHGLASVTVVDASTMWADGYATLLNVLGPRDAAAFAETHDVAARFVERTPAGLVVRETSAFGATGSGP